MTDNEITEDEAFLADVAHIPEVKALLIADAKLDQMLSRLVLEARLSVGKQAEIMLHVAACRNARAPFLSAIEAYKMANT